MVQPRALDSGHQDLISDVAFDHYGDRLATCACDHTVKIWDRSEDDSVPWRCVASWKAHVGAVWKVTWAHPEFGQVIATCSFDRTAAVWEEIVSDVTADHHQNTWVRRAALVDSRTSVSDVRFAPRSMGLQLATISSDGVVRIYEAADPMKLSSWSLEHELFARCSGSCLSWSSSPSITSQLLAIGSDDPPSASSASQSNHGSGGGNVTAARVLVYAYCRQARKWSKNVSTMSDRVHDLCFAPSMGRSFHLLAIASTEVRIVAISNTTRSGGGSGESAPASTAAANAGGTSSLEVRQVALLEDHRSAVWRLAWNITGSVLGTSGDDGQVRLWRANYLNDWKCVYKLVADSNLQNSGSDKGSDGALVASTADGGGRRGDNSGFGGDDTDLASSTALSTAKYFKLGTIKQHAKVAWH